MNCWDFKKCGRQVGGPKVGELGVCPASTHKAGEACWIVAGTFCGGTVQGTFAEKSNNCMLCEFYKKFDLTHRSTMRQKFGHLIGKDK